ncbi:MAG: DUF1513 domain-containing protein [Pseudomonadota bacterium]
MRPAFSRRHILAGAAGLAAARAAPGWAAAGGPSHLAAARLPSEDYVLLGLDPDGDEVFRLDLPARGHAAAARTDRPEAVAFARRPGTFAIVLDCAAGREVARLEAPVGRHFYGHGAFTADNALLLTTEQDYEAGEGRLGVWDVAAGYRRVAELPSGGIGPHEVVRLADGRFAVANGGILTHPATGRAKLNLSSMAPNLAFVSLAHNGPERIIEPPAELRQNSIRHLATRGDGLVAAALQWEGSAVEAPPLLALADPAADGFTYLAAPEPEQRRANNYAGSVAFSSDGNRVAITAPRGARAFVFDVADRALIEIIEDADICGVASAPIGGLLFTTGTGRVRRPNLPLTHHPLAFDNHLVAL